MEAENALDVLRNKLDHCLVIDGESLQKMMDEKKTQFVELCTRMSAVVCCRCSPTQKAEVATMIKKHTKRQGSDIVMRWNWQRWLNATWLLRQRYAMLWRR